LELADDLGLTAAQLAVRSLEAQIPSATPGRQPRAPLPPRAPRPPLVSRQGLAGYPWRKVALVVGVAGIGWWLWNNYGRRALRRNPDAAKMYEKFHWGRPARRAVRTKIANLPKRLVELGTLEAVIYSTKKGGRALADYIHHFGEGGSRKPKLTADPNGKRLHILGGGYDVKPEGITG
jgi:hypothetical protein